MMTTHEVVASLSEGLATPLTRQLFEQSIRPLMVERGDARKHGAKTWLYEERDLWQWRAYLRGRQFMIQQGRWAATRPYSVEDMEGIAFDLIDVDPQKEGGSDE